MSPETGEDRAGFKFKLNAGLACSLEAGDRIVQRVCYGLLLFGGDSVKEWQRQCATGDGLSEREKVYTSPP